MNKKFFLSSDKNPNEKEKNNSDEKKELETHNDEVEAKPRPKLPKIEVIIPKIKKSLIESEMKKVDKEPSYQNKEFKKIQRTIAAIIYICIVLATITSLAGIIWTVADVFIAPTGKLGLFIDLNFGYQIAIVGGFLAGFFFLLVFFFGLFKKSSHFLIKFIYKKRKLEEKYKNRTDVKIGAGGLLISLIGIMLGIIFAIIWDLITGPSGGSFSILNLLDSTGPWVLFVGISLFILIGTALFMIYFWKNGYYLILKIMGILEKEEKD